MPLVRWKHPRVCEEHWEKSVLPPPHWNTPTYVGSTQHECSLAPSAKDHPRVCGEHTRCPRMMAAIKGSPPHMRGAQFSAASARRMPPRMGIIPAYAGSTFNETFESSSIRDHPRVCGEHTTKNGRNTPFPTARTTEKLQFKHSSLIKQPS